MKLAVIETGGKQHIVQEGDVIRTEKISEDLNEGDSVTFERVLLNDDGSKTKLGEPTIKGSSVSGTLRESGRGRKINVEQFRSKSRYHRKKGHRQPYMDVEITNIAI